MFFRKKTPKRLYYPVKSSWYTKPRRKSSVRKKRFFRGGAEGAKKVIKRFAYILAVAGFFVLIGIIFVLSSYFSIKSINVDRENFNVDSAAIENELNGYIGKNIIFLQSADIRNEIMNKFPEFSFAKVSKVFPSSISIKLESHPVIANLKAYYIVKKTEEIDETDFSALSKAIEELSGSDPELLKPVILNPLGDKEVTDPVFSLDGEAGSDKPIEQKCLLNRIGQAICDREENLELMTITVRDLDAAVLDRGFVIPKESLDYIFESIQYLQTSIRMDILNMEYLPAAREVRMRTHNNLTLWISTDRSHREQIDKLITIYEAAELDKEDIAYIDLRVKEKVIYCPRRSACDK